MAAALVESWLEGLQLLLLALAWYADDPSIPTMLYSFAVSGATLPTVSDHSKTKSGMDSSGPAHT